MQESTPTEREIARVGARLGPYLWDPERGIITNPYHVPCAVYGCEKPGVAHDPRPCKVGTYYLCEEHLCEAQEAQGRAER